MLAKPDHSRRNAVHPSQSLRTEYNDFVRQRIEDYKNQLSREELLRLADEAVRAMDPGTTGQLALTEVLMMEHVDRLIENQLRLPGFGRWKNRYPRLRLAQRQATRWDIEPDCPITNLVLRLEPDEVVLVVGKRCARYGYYVAAHDNQVVFVANELNAVDDAERRAGREALSSCFEALAVDYLGRWFPAISAAVVVIDPVTVMELPSEARQDFIATLGERTAPGGTHFLPFERSGSEELALDAARLRTMYGNWTVLDHGSGGCILAIKQT